MKHKGRTAAVAAFAGAAAIVVLSKIALNFKAALLFEVAKAVAHYQASLAAAAQDGVPAGAARAIITRQPPIGPINLGLWDCVLHARVDPPNWGMLVFEIEAPPVVVEVVMAILHIRYGADLYDPESLSGVTPSWFGIVVHGDKHTYVTSLGAKLAA